MKTLLVEPGDPPSGADLEIVEPLPVATVVGEDRRSRCSSVLKLPMTDSALALPKESPTVPIEAATPSSPSLPLGLHDLRQARCQLNRGGGRPGWVTGKPRAIDIDALGDSFGGASEVYRFVNRAWNINQPGSR